MHFTLATNGQGLLAWLQQAQLVPHDALEEMRKQAKPAELDRVAAQAHSTCGSRSSVAEIDGLRWNAQPRQITIASFTSLSYHKVPASRRRSRAYAQYGLTLPYNLTGRYRGRIGRIRKRPVVRRKLVLVLVHLIHRISSEARVRCGSNW
jgi:hypothetical protein